MNITIITGKKGVGKSTYLKKMIKTSKKQYDGIITICRNRDEKKYSFLFLKDNITISCCHYDTKMVFNSNNFIKANNYLKNIKSKNIILDEIGWLELENNGLYSGLFSLLSNNNIKNLYISMRFDSYKKLIEKFKIEDYKLVIL